MRFAAIILTAVASAASIHAACPPDLNAASINLIKQFEGFAPSPKDDGFGNPTVGYGHKCQTKGCGEVQGGFPLTVDRATTLLTSDLGGFRTCLNNALNDKVKLNDNQFGALASWTFNVGCPAMKSSTLVQKLNDGGDPNTVAGEELPQWNKANGKPVDGLTKRRAAEVKLFQTASNTPALPC